EDIITILLEEDVISERNAVVYKDFIRLRKKVRKSYTSIERAEIEWMIHDNQDAITSYTNDIRNYIKNHDGVAHILHQDISGERMKTYEGYLIDLDGTMHRGDSEVKGAAEFIYRLQEHAIPYLFVTNNASLT